MAHKTTVTLPDDIWNKWKTSGQPLTEIIRHGLDGTGDSARHTATETRLAGIETRLGQLEAAGSLFSGDTPRRPVSDQLDDWEDNQEEWEQRQKENRERVVRERRDLLLERVKCLPGEPCVVTAADAMAALGTSGSTTRQYMHELVGHGLARQLDRKQGTGDPYRWIITEDDERQEAEQQ